MMKKPFGRARLPLGLLVAAIVGVPGELVGQSALLAPAAILSGRTIAVWLGLLALLALAGFVLLRSRRKAARRRPRHAAAAVAEPGLIFPILPSDPTEILPRAHTEEPLPPPRRRPRSARPPQSGGLAKRPRRPRRKIPAAEGEENGVARASQSQAAPAAPPALPPAEAPPVPSRREEPTAAPLEPVPQPSNGGELFEGNTIRYYRPTEETVQFLPGRLEVVGGEDRGQDIRFVRTWGTIPEITFGRSTGPPHRHVQLRARTASREHARLQFRAGEWQIMNLSRTNPLVINGEELGGQEAARALHDGDLIEMGEVVFRFRER